MGQGKVSWRATAGFYIIACVALCILPLKFLVAWLLALLVHELSHCATVLACGGKLQEICLTGSGVKITADIGSPGKELLCSLAGPVGGLLLLCLRRYMPITALCAFVHSVYNLLPMRSLDGGSVLYNLFCIFGGPGLAESVSEKVDKAARMVLFACMLYISWKMQWWIPAVFTGISLFGKGRSIKSTCKPALLQVQ